MAEGKKPPTMLTSKENPKDWKNKFFWVKTKLFVITAHLEKFVWQFHVLVRSFISNQIVLL